MPNLAEDLTSLLGVQTIDSRWDRLKATLAALDTGAATAAQYNANKTEFEQRKTAALKAQAAQRDAELRLETIETKTAQVNKTLYGSNAVSARDLKNLQMELDMLGRQKDDAEEKVLEAMEAAANTNAAAKSLEAELTALAETYRTTRAEWKTRSSEIGAEIAAAEAERAQAARGVSATLLARYDALRARKGGIGAAPLVADNTCGACHITLNVGLVDAVLAAAAVQFCEYCGRILVPLPRAET